jgi:AcrR family transcriptional regulator
VKTTVSDDRDARREILDAALVEFAARGFAGASVQDIIRRTRYSKPTLYYYFGSKAGLFKALLDDAYDTCYEIIRQAAQAEGDLESRLTNIVFGLFQFLGAKKDLSRLAFASVFAGPGELPPGVPDQARRHRNFEVFRELIRQGQADGVIDAARDSRELTFGIYGGVNFYLMSNVLHGDIQLTRATAANVVRLYLHGAATQPPAGRRKKQEPSPV